LKRSWIELAGAGLVTWVLHLEGLAEHLPLRPDDPFRTSVVILPLVVAALRAIERLARPGELGRPDRVHGRFAVGHLEAAALGLLLVLTLGRRSLGLAATDWFLAAGYLLLLGHRVARLLVKLRRSLGSSLENRLPERPGWAFFLLPLVFYLAIQPWMSAHRQVDGDEPYYLLVTHSLVHDFDARLANNYAGEHWRHFMDRPIEPQPGDPRGSDGEIYSRHNQLLPLVLAPAYFLAGRWGALATMAALTAALAWMVLRLAHHYAPERPGAALFAYAIFAFSPPLLVYSYQVWVEVPAALLVTAALDRLLVLRQKPRWRLFDTLALVLPLALLPLLKMRLGLLAIPFVFLAWRRARPGRTVMVILGGGFAAALGGLFLHNYLRYGNLLKIHSWSELGLLNNSWEDYARGAVGLFYDVAFGLFPSSPIWLLVLPAAWLLLRRRDRLLGDLVIIALPYLVVVAPRSEWYGGWSPPFRYTLVFLPLLALMLVSLPQRRHRPGLRALVAGLGMVTVILAVIWIVVPGWTYNFADGRTHLLDRAGARLAADVAQLFPSTVRPRPATWIWPWASLVVIPIALWPAARGRGRSAPWWGVTAVLVLTAAVPLAARSLPTRRIELEDGFVAKQSGQPFPEPWVTVRTHYRSGWMVPPGGGLVAPVVPGGKTVTLRIFASAAESGKLRIAAGEKHLATWQVAGPSWQELELGPLEWPAGAPLVIRGEGSDAADPTRLVTVDRADFTWR